MTNSPIPHTMPKQARRDEAPKPPEDSSSTKADVFRRVEVITGVGRRRRGSDEEKARIVAESLDPATTSSAVARHYGLHVSQLFTWRQQLQRERLVSPLLLVGAQRRL